MLDIVVMLFHILRAYLPSELKWSLVGQYFDMFGWTCCMGTVLYAVFWTVRCVRVLAWMAVVVVVACGLVVWC